MHILPHCVCAREDARTVLKTCAAGAIWLMLPAWIYVILNILETRNDPPCRMHRRSLATGPDRTGRVPRDIAGRTCPRGLRRMFCSRCGSREADSARFCTSCGSPLPASARQDDNARAGRDGQLSTTRRADAHALRIVLLSAALVVLACAAIALALVLPGPSETGPAPSGGGDAALQAYGAPSPETETPLYTVLTKYTWALSGYADNPGQTGGPLKDFGPDSFGGDSVSYTFSDDGSTATKVIESPDGSIRRETSSYEIISLNCCDIYSKEDGGYWRFCLAADGNLYAVLTTDDSPQSDYAVFTPASS